MEFRAPIPGQSLTDAPGSRPWERPPEITDPEEAIQMHLTRLNTAEMVEDVLDILELGVSVRQLTEGLLRSAVAEGIHSIDTSLIVAPVIHEFIKITADEAGVEYEEGLVDKKEEEKKRQAVSKAKAAKIAKKFLNENPQEPEMEEEDDIEEVTEEPQGFMQRRMK